MFVVVLLRRPKRKVYIASRFFLKKELPFKVLRNYGENQLSM
jgi:hypothetical protein